MKQFKKAPALRRKTISGGVAHSKHTVAGSPSKHLVIRDDIGGYIILTAWEAQILKNYLSKILK